MDGVQSSLSARKNTESAAFRMASLYSGLTLFLFFLSVSSFPIISLFNKRSPTPPNIPSSSTATSLLNGLTVAAQGPQTGYSRDLFPHWIIQSGTCDTRETVLKRDGTSVVTSSACAATSGSWFSPYDGATWTAASDVDIDHVVPLSNAWKVRTSCSRIGCVYLRISC
jgi:hypothetical protein